MPLVFWPEDVLKRTTPRLGNFALRGLAMTSQGPEECARRALGGASWGRLPLAASRTALAGDPTSLSFLLDRTATRNTPQADPKQPTPNSATPARPRPALVRLSQSSLKHVTCGLRLQRSVPHSQPQPSAYASLDSTDFGTSQQCRAS